MPVWFNAFSARNDLPGLAPLAFARLDQLPARDRIRARNLTGSRKQTGALGFGQACQQLTIAGNGFQQFSTAACICSTKPAVIHFIFS